MEVANIYVDTNQPFLTCFAIANGKMVVCDGNINMADRGFLYGEGLFETILVRNGSPVLLEEHLQRMTDSAKALKFPALPDIPNMHSAITNNIRGNIPANHALKLILTRTGPGCHAESQEMRLFVQIREYAAPSKQLYEQGATLVTASAARSAQSQLHAHKTLNYMENIMARQEAQSQGGYEALILNTDDFIAECSMANIFFVIDGELTTPSLISNILPGITRDAIISLAAQNSIPISEQLLGFVDIVNADEVFICNSLIGIMPIAEIDGKIFGKEQPGPITRRLAKLYHENILSGDSPAPAPQSNGSVYGILREKLRAICEEKGWVDQSIIVTARDLTPKEAIGTTSHDDYPILKGKEVIIEAVFMGEPGHAFTNMPGHFGGRTEDILIMPLKNNFERAVFIASLNAILRKAGIAEKTAHCKDKDPVECAEYLQEFMEEFVEKPRVLQIGYQPRMADFFAERYDFRLTDMDPDNIGKEIKGTTIDPPEKLPENIDWCDVVFATGSTFVNDTAGGIIKSGKPVVFYGVSCAGATELLNLPRFCPLGR